jgi:hypothetical protein
MNLEEKWNWFHEFWTCTEFDMNLFSLEQIQKVSECKGFKIQTALWARTALRPSSPG